MARLAPVNWLRLMMPLLPNEVSRLPLGWNRAKNPSGWALSCVGDVQASTAPPATRLPLASRLPPAAWQEAKDGTKVAMATSSVPPEPKEVSRVPLAL